MLRPLSLEDIEFAVELWGDEDVTRYAGGVIAAQEIRQNMPKYIRRAGNGGIGL